MRRKLMKAAALITAAVLVLSLAACSGSGNNTAPTNNTVPANNTEHANNVVPADNTTPSDNTVPPDNTVPKDEFIEAGSIEELLAAAKPGARVRLKAGTYKITEPIIISGRDIVISGGSDNFSDTQILAEPSDIDVVVLSSCTGVTLKNLTLGHVQTAECSGDVIRIENSAQTVLENMDLFGCGVYAIRMEGNNNGLSVKNSVLRDCSSGPLFVAENVAAGKVELTDCKLTGSSGCGRFGLGLCSALYFKSCSFGQAESDYYLFADHVIKENCEFSEPSMYPEYGPWSPLFLLQDFSRIDAGEIDMGHIDLVYTMTPKTDDFTEIQGWIPYVDLRSGEALRMVFRFMPNHTGTIYNFSWEDGQDFTWAVDKDGSAVITMGDGTQYPVTFYKLKDDEQGIDQTWICVEMDGYFYWTHIAQGDI